MGADIVGSTALKQSRGNPRINVGNDSKQGPAWFSAIQGFYFEAAQAFISEWEIKKAKSDYAENFYGPTPRFWKSVGDEVLFVKQLTDHRQLAVTLSCWFSAVSRMRMFLKSENQALDVKCTAWLAGFPYRNREVVIGNQLELQTRKIENYYKSSGSLLNTHYRRPKTSNLDVDYIGPSIDTGFRLSQFSTGRKMILSVDAAYMLSMTNFDGEIHRIDLFYEGSFPMKGVFGGATYPIFWIDMSHEDSLARKEDRLKANLPCNKEDIKEYCDEFYREHDNFTFRPFIKDDPGQNFARLPQGYNEYHKALVKNFFDKDIEDSTDDSEITSQPSQEADPADLQKLIDELRNRVDETESDNQNR